MSGVSGQGSGVGGSDQRPLSIPVDWRLPAGQSVLSRGLQMLADAFAHLAERELPLTSDGMREVSEILIGYASDAEELELQWADAVDEGPVP